MPSQDLGATAMTNEQSRRGFLAVAGTGTAVAAGAALLGGAGQAAAARPGATPDTHVPAVATTPLVAYVRDAHTGEVRVHGRRPRGRRARPRTRRPHRPRRPWRNDVVAPRSTGDLEGSGRRQHRRLRVRQPRQPEHRHADRQLHPAPAAGRRPELLRVRRRRRSTRSTSRTGQGRGGHHLQVPTSHRDPQRRTRSCTTPARSRSIDDTNWNRPQFYSVDPGQSGGKHDARSAPT